MVICPYTNVCVFADSFCNGVNDCGDNADEDTNICGQRLYLYHDNNKKALLTPRAARDSAPW